MRRRIFLERNFKVIYLLRSGVHDQNTIDELSRVHIKLYDASTIINRTLSPLLTFSFGITFGMLCMFLYSSVVFTADVWKKRIWFATAHSMVNFHLFAIMLGVLWAAETTTRVEREIIKHLFELVIQTEDRSEIFKVKSAKGRFTKG